MTGVRRKTGKRKKNQIGMSKERKQRRIDRK